MKTFTENYSIKISKQQKETLAKLKKYDVNVNEFIRQAIKEKIERDWKNIKEKKEKIICPF